MSFGFSVGDFLAGLKLGWTIVGALKDSGGSAEKWQKLDDDLKKFRDSVGKAKDIYEKGVDFGLSELDENGRDMVEGIKESLRMCHEAAEGCLGILEPYRCVFEWRRSGLEAKAKRAFAKTKYAFVEPEALKGFRQALDNGLSMYNVKSLELANYLMRQTYASTRNISRDQQAFKVLIQALHTEQMRVLETINAERGQQQRLMVHMKRVQNEHTSLVLRSEETQAVLARKMDDVATKIASAAERTSGLPHKALSGQERLSKPSETVKTGGASADVENRTLVRRTAIHFEPYLMALFLPLAFAFTAAAKLLQFTKHLPKSITFTWQAWSVLSSSILVEDATGRKLFFQLNICGSLAQLRGLLEVSFRNRPGHGKVRDERYSILDGDSEYEIESEQQYALALSPGKILYMSIEVEVSEDFGLEGGDTCPICSTISFRGRGERKTNQCFSCEAFFWKKELNDKKESYL